MDVMGDVMRPSSHIKKSSGFIIELSGAISGLKSIRLTRDLVAKKYISTCSSVGCLKCVQFHNWFRLH